MSSVTRLLLLTAVWKRPALTRLVLSTYQRAREELAPEIDLRLLAVGSEGEDSRSLRGDCGFDYVEHANEPLSYKWNAGVQAARDHDPDGIVIVGSDGLLSTSTFGAHARKLQEGQDFFGFRDLYFFDPIRRRLGYWGGYEHSPQKDRAGEPIGSGRCFSRRLLDRMDWNLWPREPRVNNLLDRLCLNFAKVHGFRPSAWRLEELGVRAVEIKLGPNITAFDTIEYLRLLEGDEALQYPRLLLSEDELEMLPTLLEPWTPESLE
jgi:hypothetical protein